MLFEYSRLLLSNFLREGLEVVTTIAETVRNVMLENGEKYIWFGATFVLDKCSEQLGYSQLHPAIRSQRILNALERSQSFQKSYMRFEVNGRMRRVRCFQLLK